MVSPKSTFETIPEGAGDYREERDCEPCAVGGMGAFGLRIGLSLALAGQGMVFGLGYNNALLSGEAPPYGSTAYMVLHGALFFSALAVIALLGGPLLRESWEALRKRRLSVEALFVLSAAGAFTGSLVSSITGSGSVYYEVVSVVLCVYAIGKQIGAVQKGRVGAAVQAFRTAFDTAVVAGPDEKRYRVPVRSIDEGSRVVVGPGEPIPVDAVIESGNGYVRETALTGEPTPVVRGPGDVVKAGTWSVDGNFRLKPEATIRREVDSILEMLEGAPASPSRLQEAADRLMQYFVPLVASVAVGTFLGWFFLSEGPWWNALFNAMAVLLVACPCALGLAMPAGIWAGLYYLGQRGLVGRHGHLIDSLAHCRSLVFDKTGTLTAFDLRATVMPVGSDGPALAVLKEEIASLGKVGKHPVSTALGALDDAAKPVASLVVFPGKGLEGRVGEATLRMGERNLLTDAGIPVPDALPEEKGKPVYVARNGSLVAVVFLQERLRPSAEETLSALRGLGCDIHILSGDPSPGFTSIGGTPVHGALSPDAKAAYVRTLAANGSKILFIGDGINDVPAMQEAEGSLSIELGAALATESSDGLLVNGQIAILPAAIRQSRRILSQLSGNLRFALLYNLIGMGLAASGILHPVVAALLMVGSSVIVSMRALRSASRIA